MAINLLEMMQKSFGSTLVREASKFLGEPEAATKGAVGALLPAMLGGMMQKASTPAGLGSLMSMLSGPNVDSGIMGSLGSMLGGGDKTTALLKTGASLMSGLFGDKVGGLAQALGSTSGMKSSSITNLLGLAAPVALGFVKKYVSDNKLDASGLANLLMGQKEHLGGALDGRITNALGFGSPAAFLSSLGDKAGAAVSGAAATASRAADAGMGAARDLAHAGAGAAAAGGSSMKRWLPWVILAILAALILPRLSQCGQQATQKTSDAAKSAVTATTDAAKSATAAVTAAVKSIELPGGGKIEATAGGFYDQLIAYLNSKDAAAGKGFVFEDLHFDTASAALGGASLKTLQNVVLILKAYPNLVVSVEGHTDNTGDAGANKKLSTDRAAQVEKALEDLGIGGDRITSAGWGAEKPIASNDTEAGRAQNRRVELVIRKL